MGPRGFPKGFVERQRGGDMYIFYVEESLVLKQDINCFCHSAIGVQHNQDREKASRSHR